MKALVVDRLQDLLKGQGWQDLEYWLVIMILQLLIRVVDTGTRVSKRSDEVTGDIDYQPRFEVKWIGESTIIKNRLQQMRGEKRIQTRSEIIANNQSQRNSTINKTNFPGK